MSIKRNLNIKFAFFGTPSFAVWVLEELEKKGLVPSLVVTAPDKPQGRGLIFTLPPVKIWARERNIPVLQPEKFNSHDSRTSLDSGVWSELSSSLFDLFVVAAYGKIIPKYILDIPHHGTLNVHPSLLPRLRGASPIQSAILGEEKTGVSIMLLDEEMDHGLIIAQKEYRIEDFTNNPPRGSELGNALALFGGKLLAETVQDWISGKITPILQDHSKATYCKKIMKEDGKIDLVADPLINLRKIRAFDKWPGAYFFYELKGKQVRVRITDAKVEDNKLLISRVIPNGKKEMSYEEFRRGIRV